MSALRLYSPALVLALWAVAALALDAWVVSAVGVAALALSAAVHVSEWGRPDR
jgi:hypothetical protein